MEYCFSRQPFSPDANMVAVQMQFTNSATSDAKNLHMEDVKLQSGMRVKEFPEIGEGLVGGDQWCYRLKLLEGVHRQLVP